eukprot:4954391-Pyramimonas_sp.AAC.1
MQSSAHVCHGKAQACPDSFKDGDLNTMHVHGIADTVRLFIVGYCRASWITTGCLVRRGRQFVEMDRCLGCARRVATRWGGWAYRTVGYQLVREHWEYTGRGPAQS